LFLFPLAFPLCEAFEQRTISIWHRTSSIEYCMRYGILNIECTMNIECKTLIIKNEIARINQISSKRAGP
jgi:hypothetical protein